MEKNLFEHKYLHTVAAILSICTIVSGCRYFDDSPPPPTLEQYREKTALLTNLCRKFADERDPAKLHEVVLSVQLTRSVVCDTHVKDECDVFNDFMVLVLEQTANGRFARGTQKKLKDKCDELDSAVAAGEEKLSE